MVFRVINEGKGVNKEEKSFSLVRGLVKEDESVKQADKEW